jgi:hypothetical protein
MAGKEAFLNSRAVIFTISVTALGLLVGLALHFLAVFLRDNGPSFDGISLRGNGALIVLPVALLVLILGEILAVRRRAWLAVVLLPIALFVGLFVIAGSF